MQTSIELSESVRRRLDIISEPKGQPVEQIIQVAIERLLSSHEDAADAARGEVQSHALRSIFGRWKDRGVSTEDYMADFRQDPDR